MKKVFVIVLAALMLVSLAACGGKTGDGKPAATEPPVSGDSAQSGATEAPAATTQPAAPAAALIPGELWQLDPDAPVVRGVTLAGNRAGTGEFNAREPAAKGIRCIFETNEWVEITPDTDEKEGLAVWIFAHKDDPEAYRDASFSEEAEGYAAYAELKFDPEAEPGYPWGSFYLHPEECEPGYYDLVFTLNGKATAVTLTRFYGDGELSDKTDDVLTQLMSGLN